MEYDMLTATVNIHDGDIFKTLFVQSGEVKQTYL